MKEYSYIYDDNTFKKIKNNKNIYLILFVILSIIIVTLNIILYFKINNLLTYSIILIVSNFILINLDVLMFIKKVLILCKKYNFIVELINGNKNELTYKFIKEDEEIIEKGLAYKVIMFTSKDNNEISLKVLKEYYFKLDENKSYDLIQIGDYLYAISK